MRLSLHMIYLFCVRRAFGRFELVFLLVFYCCQCVGLWKSNLHSFHNSCRSEMQAQFCRGFCSASHKAAISSSARLGFCLEIKVVFQGHTLVMEFSLSPWPSARSHSVALCHHGPLTSPPTSRHRFLPG